MKSSSHHGDTKYVFYADSTEIITTLARPRGYKTFSMLNSVEHEIFSALKC